MVTDDNGCPTVKVIYFNTFQNSLTRFEGSVGCGKTTAAKLISTLLYGEPQHKKSTDAANYTDGSQNPLIALDNIEVKQMTDELTAFMLTSITGVAREKRRGGTDSETIVEKTSSETANA